LSILRSLSLSLALIMALSSLTLSMEMLINYPLHEVLEADLSPKGELLATLHAGNFIEIRATKPPYLDGRIYSEDRDEVESLGFLDDKNLLVIRKGKVEIWERVNIGKWHLRISLRRAPSLPLTYARGKIAYMTSEEEIEIYDIKSERSLSKISNLPDFVKELSLSESEEVLFVLLKGGELLAYQASDGKLISEIGKVKERLRSFGDRGLIIEGKRIKIVNFGDLSQLHEIKLEEKVDKAMMRGENLLLLSSKGRGYLFKLKEGEYILERKIEDLQKCKVRLTSKGVLIWDDEELKLNDGELKLRYANLLKPRMADLEGEKLVEIGENFALVWNLTTFSPEIFFTGRAILLNGKLYMEEKEDSYICYDLRSEESQEIKERGRIVEGNELFFWEPPYLKWKGERIKLKEAPRKAHLLKREGVILTDEGLYSLKSGERLLDLRNKTFLLSERLSSLILLNKNEIAVYDLKSRVIKNLKIPYKEAVLSESGNLIALTSPDDYGILLLDLREERDKAIYSEKVGKIKKVTFIGENMAIVGEEGFSLFDENGKEKIFEGMNDIIGLEKVDEDRILIARANGTLWLYSTRRKRPMIYHDLNGSLVFAKMKGERILVILETGEVYVLSSRNLRPWFSFLFFSLDDWLVLSSENYFNSSPSAKDRIMWLEGRSIYQGERGFERYMSARKLKEVWDELR